MIIIIQIKQVMIIIIQIKQASYDNYYSNQDKFWTQGVAD